MPTPSEHIRLSLEARLDERARATWPQLQRLHVRHRGAFAYVEAELADRWGFALYLASNERYEDSLLPAGTPADALDCACRIHIASLLVGSCIQLSSVLCENE
ncbi:hypothetical protein [Streptomyces sp. NBC_01462]|uniref:hypothetical protein n=1 Tax=Streptomyces sp. NBC_01462 TaxID=2903876 RepID=UPI002E348138|nr:hypothetical protein [Streptomyces sp. NBC_01462]